MKIPECLSNHFLIAMPSLEDAFFTKSVIYLHQHSDLGAMGVVINKPLQVNLESLLQHLDIEVKDKNVADLPVLAGGPSTQEQGFVIHDRLTSDNEKADGIAVSATKEMLCDIANSNGPDHFIVMLGYAGWEAGQLEDEIRHNDWLVAPFDASILFSTPLEKRWQLAAKKLGIDIHQLSGHSGHA
jgi:putative transcriptional regulator